MLKWAGAFLIVARSAGWGALERLRLYLSVRQLKEAENLIVCLGSEISYGKSSLGEACREAAKRVQEPYASFLQTVYGKSLENNGQSFENLWKQQLIHITGQLLLNEEARKLVEKFGACSGCMDPGLQKVSVERIRKELHRVVVKAEEECDNRAKISLCLSAAGGIVLAMILL